MTAIGTNFDSVAFPVMKMFVETRDTQADTFTVLNVDTYLFVSLLKCWKIKLKKCIVNL